MQTQTVARALLVAATLLVAAAPVAAQDARHRGPCFTAGRTVDCTFTLSFDAATERFTHVRGRPRGDSAAVDTASMPFDRFTLPVLTGDLVLVEVHNLPYGERIDAGATSAAATPFPRPGLDETLSLSAITLRSFASANLPRQADSNLSGTGFVTADQFTFSPAEFQRVWNERVRTNLAAYTDELMKRAQAVTPEARTRLSAQARALEAASPTVAENLDSLARALESSAARLQTDCVGADRDLAERQCLPRLYEASTLAQRQSALVRSLRQLTSMLGLESAAALADSVRRALESPTAQTILANNLEAALQLAGTSESQLSSDLGLGDSDTQARANLKANLAHAVADLPGLQRYQELRKKLTELDTEVRDEIVKVREAAERLDAGRLRLALASNRLIFAFDAAAARPGLPLRVPVFRTTSDEEVTVTLTRTPRFAAFPQVQLAAEAVNPKKDQADAPPSTTARTYTEKLRARKRHYFQIIAGFVFSDIRSSRFGVVDALESRDTDGNGTAEAATVRRISQTADRPRMFVPAAQLVFHPLGKDVHPDAYRTRAALRPGIAIGTTLDAPVTNFSVGLAVEPVPGLHLTGGRLWSQVQGLQAGWAVGDELPAATEAAPTRDRFAKGWYVGGMLDMGVFAGFFGELLGGGE